MLSLVDEQICCSLIDNMKRFKSHIINSDSRRLSELFPEGVEVQTTISSPPYYDMKDYGVDGQVGFGQSYSAYLDDIASIFAQVLSHTKEDGSLWLIVDTFKRNGNLVLLPFDIAERLKGVGWHLQNIIIWKKDKTVPWASGGFVQRKFEYILFFSKSDRFKSYGDRLRVADTSQLKSWWIKYPERYNPKGKALDEIWSFSIPFQGSWGKEYIRNFCPLPKDMVSTMIALSTDERDIVFDPFSGTGTVPAVAAYMNRRYLGVELNNQYVKQSRQYIKTTFSQGRKAYYSSINLDRDVFEQMVHNLRALKYGRIVLNRIEKEYNKQGQLRIEVSAPKIVDNSDCLSVSYIIFGDVNECESREFLKSIILTAPLSKFGINSVFSFDKAFPSSLDGYFCYSRTNSHQYLKGVLPSSSKIALISPIMVDINEKDFI